MRISDWSSDVCSSDLAADVGGGAVAGSPQERGRGRPPQDHPIHPLRHGRAGAGAGGGYFGGAGIPAGPDRKSVVWGKSVSVRVALGGRRIIKKNNRQQITIYS